MSLVSWTHAGRPSDPQDYVMAGTGDLNDLLTAVGASRDGAAFAVLFNHFGRRVQTQMLRLGLAPVAAEDVAQDVMETIWRKAHLYDAGKAAAATWIFQIARNRRIDMRRRLRETSCAVEDFIAIPDSSDPIDDRLDAGQRHERLRAALGALPHEQFTLVQLAFFEGLSHGAIARQLRLPLGTVKSRLRLAFARLRRLLVEAGVTQA